ncbi:MAG: hypothetical protein H6739_42040 [Alphaproteobacteria bacterium]|nr:hypothetical protein [Alphaproteobacteria bacterium]
MSAPHWSLRGFEDALVRGPLPDGPLDPFGAWVQRWRIHRLRYAVEHMGVDEAGWLTLTRQPAPDGGFTLDVEQRLTLIRGAQLTRAAMRCAVDPLGTVQDWTVDTVTLDAAGDPEPLTHLTLRSPPGATPTCSSWSLMEAVQRIPEVGEQGLRFEMLEELVVRRPEQRLLFEGAAVWETGSGTRWLMGYRRVGVAAPPVFYWVDEDGRVLLVASVGRLLVAEEPT